VARTNYQQIKRQKEAARKHRQQTRLDRRIRRDSADPAPVDIDSPATPAPVLPSDHASK
jgi:hypothetical protein